MIFCVISATVSVFSVLSSLATGAAVTGGGGAGAAAAAILGMVLAPPYARTPLAVVDEFVAVDGAVVLGAVVFDDVAVAAVDAVLYGDV